MRLIIGGVYQGRESYAREKYGKDINIYRGVMDDLRAGLDKKAIILKAVEADAVIAEEPYCGLAPMDMEINKLYENYGRVMEQIASEAESVERVVCGLAQSLK